MNPCFGRVKGQVSPSNDGVIESSAKVRVGRWASDPDGRFGGKVRVMVMPRVEDQDRDAKLVSSHEGGKVAADHDHLLGLVPRVDA